MILLLAIACGILIALLGGTGVFVYKFFKQNQEKQKQLEEKLKEQQKQIEEQQGTGPYLVSSLWLNKKLYEAAMSQLERAEHYEDFYNQSIEVVDGFHEHLEKLMTQRQMISDDPDVQMIYSTVSHLHDYLLDYLNAKPAASETPDTDRPEQEKEEQ